MHDGRSESLHPSSVVRSRALSAGVLALGGLIVAGAASLGCTDADELVDSSVAVEGVAQRVVVQWLLGLTPNAKQVQAAGQDARPVAKAVAGTSLSAFTPTVSFLGNRTIVTRQDWTGSNTVSQVMLRREPDCSLTQLFMSAPSSITATLTGTGTLRTTLPGAESYLHQLAELSTTPMSATGPCPPPRPGVMGLSAHLLGRTPGGNLVGAMLRYQDSTLRRIEVTPAGQVVSAATLATATNAPLNAADLNGDGIDDVVSPWATSGGVGGLLVALSRPDGSFAAPVVRAYTGSRYNAYTAIDDVDGDGKLDVVAIGATDFGGVPTVTVWRGDGAGGLTAGPTGTFAGLAARFVIADLDGDGHKDLLTAEGVMLAGAGDGSFGPRRVALPALNQYAGLAVGDLDGDGKPDVVATTSPSPGLVVIFRGDGTGGFATAGAYAGSLTANGIAIDDVNRDGVADVVVGSRSREYLGPDGVILQVLFGRGDGSFVGAPAIPSPMLGLAPLGGFVALADYGGDGKTDLLAPAPRALDSAVPTGPGSLSVHAGLGDGRFAAPASLPVSDAVPLAVATGDVDGDGKPDAIYVGRGRVGVLRALGGGAFGVERGQPLGNPNQLVNQPSNLAVGDFDGDGRADVVVTVSAFGASGVPTPGASVFFALADGGLAEGVRIDTSRLAGFLAIADLDGDGRSDLVLGDDSRNGIDAGSVRIYRGRADRTFSAPATLTPAAFPQALAVGDLNGDGVPDLVVAAKESTSSTQLYTYLGSGGGAFLAPVARMLAGSISAVRALAIADFNRDGKPDVAMSAGGVTGFVLGNGDGTFQAGEPQLAIAGQAAGLAVASLDGDRQPDLVATVEYGGVVSLVNRTVDWATPPVAPNEFAIALGSDSGTVASGQSVQATISVAVGSAFAQPVGFACANLPANAVCRFGPSTVLPGSGASSVTLTISTGTALAAVPAPHRLALGDGPGAPDPRTLVAGAALAGAAGGTLWPAGSGAGGRRRRRWAVAALLALGVVAGCGGGGPGDAACGPMEKCVDPARPGAPPSIVARATPAGTYPITITATGGSLSRSATYTLTVR